MNMQFGFGGYDPYMMMGYGNFNPSGYSGGFGGGFGGFGGFGGYGGFSPFGGGFPNYYPMFNPMALYSMGRQFYNNQFMQPLQPFNGQSSEPTGTQTQVPQVDQMESPMVDQAGTEVTQVGNAATSAANGQQVSTNSPVVNTHYDEAVKNPVQYQKAGKFSSAEERTRAGNQLFKAGQDIGGKVGQRVAKLASSGRVKKAQSVLGQKQMRDVRKRG